MLTVKDLVEFEEEIAAHFNNAKIAAPVHLYSGNEQAMLGIFQEVREEDWVLCSWRSHYQCLLKGVPRQELLDEIMRGHSISLCFPRYRVLSSGIVGGVVPIAVGIALSIKLKKERSRVFCFMGEMTSETGIAHESIKYSFNHKLPIRFIVEDNGKSVCTDTRESWNQPALTAEQASHPMVVYYKYETKYPHAGAGVRVQF